MCHVMLLVTITGWLPSVRPQEKHNVIKIKKKKGCGKLTINGPCALFFSLIMLHCRQQICVEIRRRKASQLSAAGVYQSPAMCLAEGADR